MFRMSGMEEEILHMAFIGLVRHTARTGLNKRGDVGWSQNFEESGKSMKLT